MNKVIADLVLVGLDPSSLFDLFCCCPAVYTLIQHTVDIMCLLILWVYMCIGDISDLTV